MYYQLRTLARSAWHGLSTAQFPDRTGAAATARVESPRPLQAFVHHVYVRGWIAGDLDAPRVVVLRSGREIGELAVAAVPAHATTAPPDSRHVLSFSGSVDGGRIGSGRLVWLRVVLEHRQGGGTRRQTLATLPVRHASRHRRQLPRHEYGRVWDQTKVSGSVAEARRSVCGTTSEAEYERSGQATAQDIADAVGVTPQDTILEIGCGTGRVGAHLAPRCRQWIGGDVSSNMLRYAAAALASHANVSFVQLDGSGLTGVADASIDVAYCTGVFMHLEEWDRYRYVQEAFRVLRPGGRVYFDNFSLTSPEGWALFADLASLDVAQRPSNISKASTPAELTAYAAHAGFADVAVKEGALWVTVTGRKAAGAGARPAADAAARTAAAAR